MSLKGSLGTSLEGSLGMSLEGSLGTSFFTIVLSAFQT